ncbi:MAG: hypothetical protein K8W52_10375 [Deltaproteobacteria bacterium]|nr:hypothetical protein [Deltaproteobacteria bacterium]
MPSPVQVEYRTAGWIALALVLASGVLLWPFGPWVLLATWLAVSARRMHRPLTRGLGGRPRAAAVLTIVSVALVVVPVVIL